MVGLATDTTPTSAGTAHNEENTIEVSGIAMSLEQARLKAIETLCGLSSEVLKLDWPGIKQNCLNVERNSIGLQNQSIPVMKRLLGNPTSDRTQMVWTWFHAVFKTLHDKQKDVKSSLYGVFGSLYTLLKR